MTYRRWSRACPPAAALFAVAAAGALSAPSPARAAEGAGVVAEYPPCTKEPTNEDVEGARGAHRAARQFFERGDYARAVSYWRDAYGFDCTRPPVLLNIADAYEMLGDREAAVALNELYLERAPDAEDATKVREKVQNLRAKIAAAKEAAQPDEPLPAVVPPPVAPAEELETRRPFGLLPWIPVGVGGGAAVAGVVLTLVGQGKVSDAEDQCPTRRDCSPEVTELGNDGRSLRTVGTVVLIGGGVAVVGGLVWQFAFNAPEPVPREGGVRFEPVVAPGYAGVGLGGRF